MLVTILILFGFAVLVGAVIRWASPGPGPIRESGEPRVRSGSSTAWWAGAGTAGYYGGDSGSSNCDSGGFGGGFDGGGGGGDGGGGC